MDTKYWVSNEMFNQQRHAAALALGMQEAFDRYTFTIEQQIGGAWRVVIPGEQPTPEIGAVLQTFVAGYGYGLLSI